MTRALSGFAALLILRCAAVSAQVTDLPTFQIRVEQPAYAGLPVWISADLNDRLTVRYPYRVQLTSLGPNTLELRKDGQLVRPVSPHRPLPGFESGGPDASVAPRDSPTNRLPLHLVFDLSAPGSYSVRWTRLYDRWDPAKGVATVAVARSDWLRFDVSASTAVQKESWLARQIATPPPARGQVVGDYLPSLLAGAPDPRVLKAVLARLYSTDSLEANCALYSLPLFRDDDVRAQVLDFLKSSGPAEPMAYLVSWRADWFREQADDIVRTASSWLQRGDDPMVAAALQLLNFVAHSAERFPVSNDARNTADAVVLEAGSALATRRGRVPQQLALYLGGLKEPAAHDLLWKLAAGDNPGQAWIVLASLADDRDFDRLGALLLDAGDTDPMGRTRAHLPMLLVKGYGDRAISLLEKALAESPYVFVRTDSAEELALQGKASGFRFLLDAVENNRFYKNEMMTFVRDRFRENVPHGSTDEALVAFLRSRAGP